MRLSVRSSSTSARSKSPVNRSRVTRSGSSASSKTRLGGCDSFACVWICFQSFIRNSRSSRTSSAEAPSAAVRTITPPCLGAISLTMSRRRLRSSSSSRRETPRPSPCGTKTTKRPGSEISVVSRAPFVFIGSLTACTSTCSPRLIRSVIRRPRGRSALELWADDLVDEQEAVLLQSDLDERRLHPREDVVDDALVDVPGDRAALGPLEVDLGDAVVLEHGDPLLGDVDRDEQLALRGRERRAPRHLAAAARRASPPVRGSLAVLRGPLGLRGSRSPLLPLRRLRGRGRVRRLATIPAAATAAAAIGLGGLFARLGLGREGRAARCFLLAERLLLGRQLGERRRDRRRGLTLLPAKPWQGQMKSPSHARATATTRASGRRCAAG